MRHGVDPRVGVAPETVHQAQALTVDCTVCPGPKGFSSPGNPLLIYTEGRPKGVTASRDSAGGIRTNEQRLRDTTVANVIYPNYFLSKVEISGRPKGLTEEMGRVENGQAPRGPQRSGSRAPALDFGRGSPGRASP